MKRALITGITGQDGSYLADFLLEKGYEVHGVIRRSSTKNFARISHIQEKLHLHHADLFDQMSLLRAVEKSEPDEVYNLAAQSFVPTSWNEPTLTGEFTGLGVTKILEAIRKVNKKIKFYQASSSEMFGQVIETPQKETTRFYPRSPYGVAKVYGHYITINYRESYDMFAVAGILFNHESPRRGLEFVSRKISNGVARIKSGEMKNLALGNMDAKRDWGYAKDYVEAMWMMLQNKTPQDYVIATNECHSVREFTELAFARAGLDYKAHVVIDKSLWRPAEVHLLQGDYSKAKAELGWGPRTSFKDLVHMMVDSDLDLAVK